MIKKTALLSFCLAVLLLLSSFCVIAADDDASIVAEAERIHEQALATYNQKTGSSSFYGNCGIYISYLLHTLGIDDYLGGHNGNQWYDAFQNDQKLNGSYTAVKFGGSDCLYDLIREYGNVDYVLVSFTHQTGYSNENPGAGHVVFINRISDGKVYFTESYGMYGIAEGKAHIMTIERLLELYMDWYGDPIGAVWFSDGKTPPLSAAEVVTEEATTAIPIGSALYALPYFIDADSEKISRIPPKTKISEVKNILSEVETQFIATDGTLTADDEAYISTGMLLCLYEESGSGTWQLAVQGDLSGDGMVTSADARLALRKAAGLSDGEFTDCMLTAADMNFDQKVNSSDARSILRIAARLSES